MREGRQISNPARIAAPGFIRWGVLIAAAFVLLPTIRVQAQDTPEFDVDMITLRDVNSGGPRVEVYTRIPRARLRFINSPNGFVASYEVSVDIIEIDSEGRRSNIVQSPLWERNVRVSNYIETTDATESDFSTHSLSIDPGLYVFEFQIQDKSSNESFVVEKMFAVRDIAGESALSDVLLLERFDEATNTIYPNVTKRVGSAHDSLAFFYELYLDEPGDVVINRKLRRVSGGTLPSLRAPVSNEATASENDNIVFQNSIERRVDSERSQLIARLPVTDLQVGIYEATFQIVGMGGTILSEAQTNFEVAWTGLEEHLANLDDAILQLQYIAKGREVRRIREPEAETDRWQRFVEFWERRDPTPGTARNEKMEEYYYRVAYANRQYSSITEGWRTDRGQVWVLYGEPDIVERHPYNFNVKPYEVWFYYRIGRRFIFVDQTGLGDYQLMVPIWDETTRIR